SGLSQWPVRYRTLLEPTRLHGRKPGEAHDRPSLVADEGRRIAARLFSHARCRPGFNLLSLSHYRYRYAGDAGNQVRSARASRFRKTIAAPATRVQQPPHRKSFPRLRVHQILPGPGQHSRSFGCAVRLLYRTQANLRLEWVTEDCSQVG